MNTHASAMVELLILLTAVVLTSGGILFMIKTGVLNVRAEGSASSEVLNTEFIPYAREGYLAVKEVKFCTFVDKSFHCFDERTQFRRGEKVYVVFLAESSTLNGEALLARNYRLRNPQGRTLLELDEKNSYRFDVKSEKKQEFVAFADYFATAENYFPGEYTLEIVIENPLLNKKVVRSERFMLE